MAKTLIYDGDCPMCGWIARRFGELGLADDGHRRPYQSFDGELAERIAAAGIHNEMLVHDAASDELRAGIEGFLWLLGDSRWRWLGGLLGLAPVRGLMRLVYRTIAYNRRILAPPPRGIVCACDPDPHAGFRAFFLAVLAVFDLAGAWLLGLSVSRAFDGPGALPITVLAILALLAGLLALRVALPREPSELLGSLLVSVAGGVLVAAPGLLLSLALDGLGAQVLVGIAVGLGTWRSLRSARRRLTRPALASPTANLDPQR